eukprot:scaffold245339_cov59-Attheya_sp.AAC.1
MALLIRASETKFGNKGRCGGTFSMKEILTDSIKGMQFGTKRPLTRGMTQTVTLSVSFFGNAIKLEMNVQIDPNDRDAVIFNDFQIRLRDGLCTD